jgi:hypothetical protein
MNMLSDVCTSSSPSKMLTFSFLISTGFGYSTFFSVLLGLPLPIRAAREFLKSSSFDFGASVTLGFSGIFGGSDLTGAVIFDSNLSFYSIFGGSTLDNYSILG